MSAAPGDAPRPSARGGLALALLAAAAGAALACLGIAQTAGALLAERGNAALVQPQEDAARAIAAFDQADAVWPDPANSFGAGRLLLRLAAAGGDGAERHALLTAAQSRIERALAQAPGNARGWAVLADARRLAEAPSQSVAEALFMSIELARFEPELLAWRCRIGLAMLDALEDAQKMALKAQVKLLARHDALQLVLAARATGTIRDVIAMLADDNGLLTRFEKDLGYVK